MRYMLLLNDPEMTEAELGPEALAEGMAAFDAYAKSLDESGALISAEVLQSVAKSTTATEENSFIRSIGFGIARP